MASKPKTIAERKEPAFTVVTTAELAGFHVGATLSQPAQWAAYFRAMLENENGGNAVNISDEDIVAGIRKTDVTGLDTDAAEIARVEHLQSMIATAQGDNDAPAIGAAVVGFSQSTMDEWTHEALDLGAKVDADTANAITLAVEGKRNWNGAPVILENRMVKLYGVEGMDMFPPVGSRRQGLKSDTIPKGMTAEEWQRGNSKVEFYLDHTDGKTKRRYTALWYAGTPEGAKLDTLIYQLKALTSEQKAIVAGTPQELIDLGQQEALSRLETAQGEWNDAINRIYNAVRLYQRKGEFTEKVKHITVNYVGVEYDEAGEPVPATLDAAAKRRKPVFLRNELNPNPSAWSAGPNITLGTLFRYDIDKAIAMAGGKVVTLADLRATLKREPKKPDSKQGQQTAAGSTTELPAADTIGKVADYLATVGQYFEADGWSGNVTRAMATKDGGRIASELVRVRDYLDKAVTEDIENLAKSYDALQVQAVAAAAANAAKEGKTELKPAA